MIAILKKKLYPNNSIQKLPFITKKKNNFFYIKKDLEYEGGIFKNILILRIINVMIFNSRKVV